MHDPATVAFDIKSPLRSRPSKMWPQGYRTTLLTIWHVDPERDGTDDSCGWFMRARHGNAATLQKVARDFEFEWGHGCPNGWFDDDESPNYSCHAITLGMFRIAANHAFGHWSGRADRFLRRHLFDILHFAENPTDSLHTFITQPYGKDARATIKSRALEAARIVYPWVLRADRPRWRHPRWHVHHWRVQWPFGQQLRRWLWSRCGHCGGRFRWGEGVVGRGWDSLPRRWFESFRGERDIFHTGCDRSAVHPRVNGDTPSTAAPS